MKFDHIIMNPPYCRNLHLKILNEAINHSDDIVNLSPIRWLQDPLAEHKKNSDWKKFENVRNHIESIEVISAKDATTLFSAGFIMNLGVYHTTDKGGWSGFDRNSIIKKVIESDCVGIPVTPYKNVNKKCFALLKGVDGTSHADRGQKPDGFILRKELHYGKYFVDGTSTNGKTLAECKESNVMATNGNINEWRVVGFDTENEAQNFYTFTKTKFVRYVYINEGTGTLNPQHKFLPFMHDYTRLWTDKDLYEYFSLTPEEIAIIESEIQ